jgi:hypothetical protein
MDSKTTMEKAKKADKAILTYICTTMGFATTPHLRLIDGETGRRGDGETHRRGDGETVTQTAFTQIFVPNGLPKLILIDSDSVFKGVLLQFFRTIRSVVLRVCPQRT